MKPHLIGLAALAVVFVFGAAGLWAAGRLGAFVGGDDE